MDNLPFDLASKVIQAAGNRHSFVNLGGGKDKLAAFLGPIIGGLRARKLVLGF